MKNKYPIYSYSPDALVKLNTSDLHNWTLYYGIQDGNKPLAPEEVMKNSGFEKIGASVPGNVEIDLEAAGVIEDPMTGNNIYDLRKFETCQWWYNLKFDNPDIPSDHIARLCFDGVDCVADIWLNNELIGQAENMFVEHQYDVSNLLKDNNELWVCIHSPILEGRKYQREHWGVRYDALGGESVNIRKAAHAYGWDILPRLVSAGIYKDVYLKTIAPNHFKSVYWVTKFVDVGLKKASLYVDWEFATDRLHIDDLVLQIKIHNGVTTVFDESFNIYSTVFRNRINDLENIEFWWPRGFGESNLYQAELSIQDKEGNVLAKDVQALGIRTARLIHTDSATEEDPGEFVFEINHERIFVKGTNWVALDALHSRDKSHIGKCVDMLVDLNCNMIRMWGGNVYEQDEFYDLCDQRGIMVWHDFMMGCTMYPQDDFFIKKIEDEAIKAINRIRRHPSLVLWAGNNENDVSLEWDDDQPHIDPNEDIISRQLLPGLVRRFDPKTPYLPSSPYISSEAFRLAGNRIDQSFAPEQHLWGPRGYYKAPYYTENHAKFVSEIGYHGCPNRQSLEKMFDRDFVYPWTNETDFIWNDQWQTKAVRSHPYATETIKRNDLMTNQIKCVFTEVPSDLDQFIAASQIIQAEAKKYFIEFWRMNKGERNGILWWNLRDGWPVISDAIVDYYYSKKLAYHYIKRVQTDVCVMVGDDRGSGHPVVIVNDTLSNVMGKYLIKDLDSGTVIQENGFEVKRNGRLEEKSLPPTKRTALWTIEWEVNGETFSNHYFNYQPQVDLEIYLKWLPMLK